MHGLPLRSEAGPRRPRRGQAVKDAFGCEIEDAPLTLTAQEAHVARVLIRAWQTFFTRGSEEDPGFAAASVYGVIEGHFPDTATHGDVQAFCAKFGLPVPPRRTTP